MVRPPFSLTTVMMIEFDHLEIRYLVTEAVDSVVDEPSQRTVLVEAIIRALEKDSSWVQHYNLAGEIQLPKIEEVDVSELEEVKQVGD